MGDVVAELCLLVEDAMSVAPDIAVQKYVSSCGGSAANFACCGSALGMDVELLSHIGDDSFTSMLTADLSHFGVSLRLVRMHGGENSVCLIVIGEDGDRRFMSLRAPDPPDNSDDVDALDDIDWLHVSGFVFQRESSAERVWLLIQRARAQGLTVSLDPSPLMAPYVRDVNPALLSHIDYIFPNAFEASALTGLQDPHQAARQLMEMGGALVVLTRGPHGVLLCGPEISREIPAFPQPQVRDSTGAGDALAAGFVAAIRKGMDPVEAARSGTISAASVISRIGGHSGADDLRTRER